VCQSVVCRRGGAAAGGKGCSSTGNRWGKQGCWSALVRPSSYVKWENWFERGNWIFPAYDTVIMFLDVIRRGSVNSPQITHVRSQTPLCLMYQVLLINTQE
jgi:hypothetical protein